MRLEPIILSIMSSLKAHSSDYCDIQTVDGYENIIFKNGSMMTLVEYNGMLSTVSRDTFRTMINDVSSQLQNLMGNSGYKIACVFRKDLDAFSSLVSVEKNQKTTARKIGLDLDDLIEENIELYRNAVYDESVIFGLITDQSALDEVEKQEIKHAAKKKVPRPPIKNAQNIFAVNEMLRPKHNNFVGKFISSFTNDDYYVSIQRINIIKALGLVRHQVQPDSSQKNWKASVAISETYARAEGMYDYRTPMMFPENDNEADMSHALPPELARQILSKPIEVLGAKEGMPPNTIRLDGRLYTYVLMDIPPNTPAIFNELFDSFNQTGFTDNRGIKRTMPWCISYLITGDGLAGSMVKKAFKDILALVPPSTNGNIQAAYNQLAFYKKQTNRPIVGLQVSAMTWVEDDLAGRDTIRTRKTRLAYVMESWGGMTVIDNVGDPILGWRSNILGLSTDHQGTKAALPLPNALELLPLTRPASPFKTGSILNRTLDGKLMLVEKFSPSLSTWVKCITGAPGNGKSVMLNNDLFETCIMPDIDRLPLITVIDKGSSSKGFVELIRDALPNHKRHQAVTKRLRKSRFSAINPFDIKVGLTKPLESEKNQMVMFLTALLTPAEADKPYEGTQGFVISVVTRMFDKIQEHGENQSPNIYQYAVNPELDKYLIEHDIVEFDENNGVPIYSSPKEISYFKLVRILHTRGVRLPIDSKERDLAWRARDLAHRLAMPILSQVAGILSDPAIKEAYRNTIKDTGETMPDFALRAITEVIGSYECFAHHTTFDVDSARVVALDLQEVINANNKQQTSLFYQVARMIGVKKLSLTEDDIESDVMPAMFKDYYKQELQNLNADRKVLAIDEMHNAKTDESFMSVLETDAREGRKWGLELIFASQDLSDFDYRKGDFQVKLLAYVTHLCLCSRPKAADMESFQRYFSKDPLIASDMRNISLTAAGLTYMSYITAKDKAYCNLMTLTVGQKRLWSLTTDQHDRLLRGYMYELAGNNRTLAIAALAYYFPSGAKKIITEYRNKMIEGKNVDPMQLEENQSNHVRNLANKALVAYEAELARVRNMNNA